MFELKRKDEVIALLIRLWATGAIAFMLLFGSNISSSYVDIIFIVGIAHFLVERIIIIPVLRSGFKTRASYFPTFAKKTSLKRILNWLLDILKMLIITILVILTYELLNTVIINIFNLNKDDVVIFMEPFGYAIIFNIYFYIIYWLHTHILIKKKKEKINEI